MPVSESALPAASVAQLRALAHPVRLRILRLCLDREMTNKELADKLGIAPGTALRHVRELLATGFLAAGEVRTGRRGALERPYRSTGAASTVAIHRSGHSDLSREVDLAAVAAHYAELAAAPPNAVVSQVRWRLRLGPAALDELAHRVEDVISEYAERDDDDATPASLLWSLHALDAPASPSAAAPTAAGEPGRRKSARRTPTPAATRRRRSRST
jgi:predicted ArsR family transcriptional regulator